MRIVIIHGQSHCGSTCHIARELAGKIIGYSHDGSRSDNDAIPQPRDARQLPLPKGACGELTEFFLPKDFGEFCCGCTRCIVDGDTKCPHYEKLAPITAAIDAADVIILASPVYVYHATGAMKALLDHYGWRWMVHRPDEKMFRKQGVCISTAAGAGMKSTNKDMGDSLFYWGVARLYKIGFGVAATDWDGVNDKKKKRIAKATDSVAKKIVRRGTSVKPGIKSKGFFFLMHLMQRNGWNKADVDYWKTKGWTDKKRPWK